MESVDDLDDNLVDCRICGTIEAPHECPHTSNAMSSDVEAELAAVLARHMARAEWPGPSRPWALDAFDVEGWKVAVFFDGPDWRDWDYVDHVIAPNGERFEPWPKADERGLPSWIAYWQPA